MGVRAYTVLVVSILGATSGCDGGKDAPSVDAAGVEPDAAMLPVDGSLVDAPSVDAVIADAPPPDAYVPAFAAAYVSEITINGLSGNIDGMVAIVNAGTGALDLSALSVVSVTEDSTPHTISFSVIGPSTTVLNPGEAAAWKNGTDGNGVSTVITEPFADEVAPNFRFTFTNSGAAVNLDVNVTVKLSLGGEVATVPMLVHFRTTGGITYNAVARVASAPP